jgi:hypothetical protein
MEASLAVTYKNLVMTTGSFNGDHDSAKIK